MQNKYKVRDIIEYIVVVVNEFAERYNLTEREAYRYISFHNGISYLKENYGIIHTLSLNEAIECVAAFCKNRGGKL